MNQATVVVPIHWTHEKLLSKQEADDFLAALAPLPWHDDGERRAHVNFGRAYHAGGAGGDEIPIIDPLFLPFMELVARAAQAPVNYVQCHRMTPDGVVKPHKDPAGMVVPMLTVGQERTFRVGGRMPQFYYRVRQSQRKIESHSPAEETLMGHGDLLVFTGGHVLHSMFPASQDPNFNQNGFDYRYSILFRWTTDVMREFGPGDDARRAGHKQQYEKALENYRSGFTDFLGRPKS